MDEEFRVSVVADTSALETSLSFLEKQAESFGDTMTKALKAAIVDGKSLGDVLRSIALQISASALSAGMKPLANLLNDFGANVVTSLGSVMPFAQGGVIGGGGHVLSQPSYFPIAGGRNGVAGEAGAEAIMPLARGSDGSLGIAAQGSAHAPPIVVNISTPDARSFLKSEAQVSAAVARAVRAGHRSL